MDLVITAFTKKYVDFAGRARRKEFWLFTLVTVLLSFLATTLDVSLGLFNPVTGIGLLGSVFSLAVLLPSIAVTVRRLHDTERSGWWFLMIFVPFIGWLVLLFFYVSKGTAGSNRFGEDPKSEGMEGPLPEST